MLTYNEVALSFVNQRSEKKHPGLEKVWDYLKKRGISRTVADACGLHVVNAIELIAAARRSPVVNAADNRLAIVFPHWRLGQEEPIEWWSSRLVDTGDAKDLKVVASFGELVDPEKVVRRAKMFCPPNEAPHAYLPPIYDWKSLAVGQRIYLHESALKALNGALLGCASVGLNGVWGWSSRKHNIALVEELRDLPWKAKQLQPVIVYDSNAWDNWQVQSAEAALAAKLFEITGQRAVALRVPKPIGGGDQGFDDFRVRVGDEEARKFLDGEGSEIEISEYQQMFLELSSRVCVVRDLGRIADQETGALMTRQVFTDVVYAHFMADVADGEEVNKVSVPRAWLADPRRVEVQNLEYAPGAPRFVRAQYRELPRLNLWQGMGVEPETGDVSPWLELLNNNIRDEFLKKWIIAWCAYPLQNLGGKILSYPLIFGPSGTGKDQFFRPLHAIYGTNAVVITRENLRSSFNSLYAMKQFVHIDEIHSKSGDRDDVAQKVKTLISWEKLAVNTKGQPEYTVSNAANYVVTDNFWDCLKLDQDDRRACVIRWGDPAEVLRDRRGDQEYWTNYVKWTRTGGAGALYSWLLEQDIRWFNPNAWAPDTPWKTQVKEASMMPMEAWMKDLWDDPSQILPGVAGDRCLWTAKEVAQIYYACSAQELTHGQIKAVAGALRNQGFTQAHGGNLIRRKPDENPERFWVLRRRGEKWDIGAASAHLKQFR